MVRAVTLIRSSALADVAEYAYAATAPAGARMIFLAGAYLLNDDGTTHAIGDDAAQAAKSLDNLGTALAAAGATIGDVISTRVLVASHEQHDLDTAWQVVRDHFGDHDVPSTLVGVTVLGYDEPLVEIEAIAAVMAPSADRAQARHTTVSEDRHADPAHHRPPGRSRPSRCRRR